MLIFVSLKTENIKVSLKGITLATTKYTYNTTNSSITFNQLGSSPTEFENATQETTGAPKDGISIFIYRDTDVDAAKGVFAAGSSVRARDLNDNQDQVYLH